jgi:hypothetical protein
MKDKCQKEEILTDQKWILQIRWKCVTARYTVAQANSKPTCDTMAYLILSRVKRDEVYYNYSEKSIEIERWNTYEVNSSKVPGRLSPVVLLLFTRLIICGTFKTIHSTIVEMLAKPIDKEYKSVIFESDVVDRLIRSKSSRRLTIFQNYFWWVYRVTWRLANQSRSCWPIFLLCIFK